jgi:hypothetical protein
MDGISLGSGLRGDSIMKAGPRDEGTSLPSVGKNAISAAIVPNLRTAASAQGGEEGCMERQIEWWLRSMTGGDNMTAGEVLKIQLGG